MKHLLILALMLSAVPAHARAIKSINCDTTWVASPKTIHKASPAPRVQSTALQREAKVYCKPKAHNHDTALMLGAATVTAVMIGAIVSANKHHDHTTIITVGSPPPGDDDDHGKKKKGRKC